MRSLSSAGGSQTLNGLKSGKDRTKVGLGSIYRNALVGVVRTPMLVSGFTPRAEPPAGLVLRPGRPNCFRDRTIRAPTSSRAPCGAERDSYYSGPSCSRYCGHLT